MRYLFIIVMLLISGCTTLPERVEIRKAPEVISMTSLPPMTELSTLVKPEIVVIFLIQNDGSVDDVKLLESSGDPEWDSAAADSLKKWRFTAPSDDVDINGRWIRYRIRIEVEDPAYLNIGEIITSSKEEADSLYQLIRAGTDFIALVRELREETKIEAVIDPRLVNIARYPEHVRKQLRNLRINHYTRPVKVGDNYIIYKRFDDYRND